MGNVWIGAKNVGVINIQVKGETVRQRAKDLASKTQERGEQKGDLT